VLVVAVVGAKYAEVWVCTDETRRRGGRGEREAEEEGRRGLGDAAAFRPGIVDVHSVPAVRFVGWSFDLFADDTASIEQSHQPCSRRKEEKERKDAPRQPRLQILRRRERNKHLRSPCGAELLVELAKEVVDVGFGGGEVFEGEEVGFGELLSGRQYC
jgi:hypothetical protein